MPEPNSAHPERTSNPEVRREASDASLRWVLIVIAVLLVFAVVVHVAMWFVFVGYQDRLSAQRRAASPLSPGPTPAAPLEPRLEQIDRLNRVSPDAGGPRDPDVELRRYGPTAEKGYVRVPLERAMDRLAGKLPARPAPPADQSRRAGGLVDGGEPNSGRLFQKGGR